MSDRLPLPVRRVLRDPIRDEAIERLVARAAGHPARRRVPYARASLGALAAATVVVLAVWSVWPHDAAVGPLRAVTGAALAERYAPNEAATLSLDDGSRVELGAGASLVTLENDAHDVSFLLEDGSVTFDVRPHGPFRWTIECGLATVTVIGTRFTIARVAHRLEVSVERGVVLVRGERVPDHARRLAAGERIELTDRDVAPPVVVLAPPAPAAEAATPPTPTAPVAHGASWRALADQTRWDDAYRALGPTGVVGASDQASVADLLVLADVARLSNHLADAVVPLERVVGEHPRDPNASLAAFSLGRIEDRLSRPDRAARAFELALTLGQLPSGLRAYALARRTASLERAGDHASAVESARAYLEELPNGSEAAAMRAIEERP